MENKNGKMLNNEQRRWLALPFRRAYCCGAHLRYTALGARHNEHMACRGGGPATPLSLSTATHSLRLYHSCDQRALLIG